MNASERIEREDGMTLLKDLYRKHPDRRRRLGLVFGILCLAPGQDIVADTILTALADTAGIAPHSEPWPHP